MLTIAVVSGVFSWYFADNDYSLVYKGCLGNDFMNSREHKGCLDKVVDRWSFGSVRNIMGCSLWDCKKNYY